VNFVDIARV